jgi:gluconokinase
MLIILFGLSGSGKNFVAEILKQSFGFEFFDADSILPQEMLDCIAQKKMFTQAMRDKFTRDIKEKITELQSTDASEKLVVTQALYKEKNRLEIQNAFPDAHFIHVQADVETIQTRLLKSHREVDPNYAKKISVNFESPQLTHITLINNTNEADVVNQLEDLLSHSPKNRTLIK